jgi:hypothetical protein
MSGAVKSAGELLRTTVEVVLNLQQNITLLQIVGVVMRSRAQTRSVYIVSNLCRLSKTEIIEINAPLGSNLSVNVVVKGVECIKRSSYYLD